MSENPEQLLPWLSLEVHRCIGALSNLVVPNKQTSDGRAQHSSRLRTARKLDAHFQSSERSSLQHNMAQTLGWPT